MGETYQVKIGKLASPEKGSFKIGPFGSSLKKDELVDSGIPVVAIENILPNNFFPKYRKFITEEKYAELRDYTILPNDVLVTTMGTIGRSAVAPEGVGKMIIDSHLFRMRLDKSKVSPKYLCYALNGFEGIQRQLSQNARGAIMQGLNTTILKECTVPLPPIAEQERIVDLLDKADSLRKLRAQVSVRIEEFISALFHEMFGNPIQNPKNWNTLKVSQLCNLIRGSSPRPKSNPKYYGGPIPRLMIEDITRDGWLVTPKVDSLTEEGAKLSRPVSAGTVVMAVSANIGLMAKVAVDACIHDGFVGFKNLNESIVDTDYFVFCLTNLREESKRLMAGAIFQNLTVAQVNGMSLPIPPLALQSEFAQRVQAARALQAAQARSEERIEALYQSMLSRAFAGEL